MGTARPTATQEGSASCTTVEVSPSSLETPYSRSKGGRCLCGAETPGAEGWELDHDHACAVGHLPHNYCVACVRGMLCVPCNRHGVSWYEGTWKPQGNAPIPLLEEWITRRIRFDGAPDSPGVVVAYVLPERAA
ncbi:endonuclease domain-containing protein [Streptomyces roseus]|uniref:endonuclease domain-containing protein n=1 Tax=Streptomyces roseus TaxID=66430 RepID=UPI0037FE7210